MFNLEFLHLIRKAELEMVIKYLPKNAQILEIGGGTGIQAKELTKKGFKIISIDVPESNYKLEKVFPVKEYDGKNLPFPDNHFDFIFSSNVLEHIKNIDGLFVEFSRVLKKKVLAYILCHLEHGGFGLTSPITLNFYNALSF